MFFHYLLHIIYISVAIPFASGAVVSVSKSRDLTNNHGTLVAPASLTPVSSGSSFSFQYFASNWCEAGYSPIGVWLTDHPPTTADLNATTGVFQDGKFMYLFGNYLIPNFGLPPLSGNPPPPSTLTLPDLSGSAEGTELYLAVVETGRDCPPGNVPLQFGLTATGVVLA